MSMSESVDNVVMPIAALISAAGDLSVIFNTLANTIDDGAAVRLQVLASRFTFYTIRTFKFRTRL